MEFKIVFSQEDLNVVSAALVEMPFKMSAPVIAKINKQLAEKTAADSKQEEKPCTA